MALQQRLFPLSCLRSAADKSSWMLLVALVAARCHHYRVYAERGFLVLALIFVHLTKRLELPSLAVQ